MHNELNPPLVEISRIATDCGVIVELGGPTWRAYDQEVRNWHRHGTRFFMYGPAGEVFDVFLDERGLLTTVPTWRTSGDRAFMRQLFRLPRMVADADLPVRLAL